MREPEISPRRRQRSLEVLPCDGALFGSIFQRSWEPMTTEQASHPLLAHELKGFVLEFFSYLSA